ncbi:MAG TPA: HAMP domain-containing sensor histidine kinase [Tenuifilaceae bacterium]|nr:HAMP domain-containing sensor histidine kinase [Bacteroidales bacterium]MDI9516321.1 HAMP domain-containing sensor histidine kinase [Bacteroidota bacterium]NLH55276.1 HAMP domain-containing histidine kinase [Rikenellaceae bacterium]OQC61581.1 MAG: Sporulation kinase D [Bacteroidetes bacterium ADurb.Bin008]HNV81453.1 HAMP domain-containing sensor histidine kinase [Tenuifilaceae bacterium]
MEVYRAKQQWKIILLFVAILIGFTSLFITNRLVKELSQEERKKILLWSEAIKELSQLTNINDTTQNFTIISEVLGNNTTVPVILTDEENNILSYRNIPDKKMDTREEADRMILSMKASKEPIVVTLLDGSKNYVYYNDSTTLTKLIYYPYIQLIIIVFFLLASYYAFSQSRKSEQNKVWVGMAKETAHQLGTPTSSFLAWVEILKGTNLSSDLISEFEKDVARLEKVVDRFSKIGSVPALKPTDLVELINDTISYLSNRTSSKISFVKKYDEREHILVPLNVTLFEWVIESIIKNAVDAIHITGEVAVSITDNTQVVYIDISDTGKGIPRSQYKTIFQPGFTTKTRGWGLGLTLSKRIVEEYHDGKIFVNHSEMDKGSSIRIVVKKTP